MPLAIPGTGILLTRDNFAVVVKTFVDGLETSVATVTATANSALTTAQNRYTKPALGIPRSDIAAAAFHGMYFRVSQSATGQPYLNADGTTATAGNRVPGTHRIFEGVDDAKALGLSATGDIHLTFDA